MTLYTILVQKWGVGAYMVMGAYKVLYSSRKCIGSRRALVCPSGPPRWPSG